ncbi:DDHD domain-containing protein [Blastocladiella britannica]|nr:DDHD domain-containing protein [Blastocladiella britannica]
MAPTANNPPLVRPYWAFATDTPRFDPSKPTPLPPVSTDATSILTGTGASTSTTDATSSSTGTTPLAWDAFDDHDAARLERMHTKLTQWRADSGLASDLVQVPGPNTGTAMAPSLLLLEAVTAASSAETTATAGSPLSPPPSIRHTRRASAAPPQHVSPPFSTTVLMGAEQQLLEVDVDLMVRYPLYWPGPVVEVRRALWFASLGVAGKWIPVDPALNRQLEAGYLKITPYAYRDGDAATATPTASTTLVPVSPPSLPPREPVGLAITQSSTSIVTVAAATPTAPTAPSSTSTATTGGDGAAAKFSVPEHRYPLFGPHLGKFVMYLDDVSASVRDDSPVSKLQMTVLTAVGAPAKAIGLHVIRGYDNLPPVVKEREAKMAEVAAQAIKAAKAAKKADAKQTAAASAAAAAAAPVAIEAATSGSRDLGSNPAQSSDSLSTGSPVPAAPQPAVVVPPGEYADPPALPHFDHLVLAIHGIGANLSQRTESVNFAKDVSDLRTGVAAAVLLSERPGTNIAVLPVHWRNSIQFATTARRAGGADSSSDNDSDDDEDSMGSQQPLRATSASSIASDVGTAVRSQRVGSKASAADIHHLPALDEIMLQQVPAIRALVSDVVLDVLLYMTPHYRAEIIRIATRELNRVYALFMSRNPTFKGRVSIFGHSLGSVIAAEIASTMGPPTTLDVSQLTAQSPLARAPHVVSYMHSIGLGGTPFPYEALPVVPVAATPGTTADGSAGGPLTPSLYFAIDGLFLAGSPAGYFLLLQGERLRARRPAPAVGSPARKPTPTIRRPGARFMYNIFSHYDPVAVRLEPLVTRSLAPIAPAKIPYTKGGLTGVKQSIDNATARAYDVFKRPAGLFSSFFSSASASVATAASGIASDSPSASTHITMRSLSSTPDLSREERRARRREYRDREDGISVLNSRHGRLDFGLQQGLLENPYIAALGSHIMYWQDLDIGNFVATEVLKTLAEDTAALPTSATKADTPNASASFAAATVVASAVVAGALADAKKRD